MTEATYYKIKLAVTETQLVRVQAEQALHAALVRQQDAFKAAGLDPLKQYRFDEAALDLVEVQQPKEQN